MTRFIVGLDGSPAAAAALRWAVAVADSSLADVAGIHAFSNPYSEVPPQEHDRLMEERLATARKEWIPAAEVEANRLAIEVRPGDAREVLPEVPRSDAPDMLVLGRTGAGGGPGLFHIGSVVEYAAHHAACPMAVVPEGFHRLPRRVLVGLDGSAESLAALHWAAWIIRPVGGTLLTAHSYESRAEWARAIRPDEWSTIAESQLVAWTKWLEDLEIETEPFAVNEPNPGATLLALAEEHGVDAIALGLRGLGRWSGVRVGGVALRVLHTASVPIVLAPEPATATSLPEISGASRALVGR